jgi:UDP-glucose 4-epimerase
MASEFDNILDNCIDRLSRGESLKRCLAYYPEYKTLLEPLLRAMTETKTAYSFVFSSEASRMRDAESSLGETATITVCK